MTPPVEEVRAAEGFFELGLYRDAWDHLERISPPGRDHPAASALCLDILGALGRWDDAARWGVGYCKEWPEHGVLFLKTATAFMRLDDYRPASDLLSRGPETLREQAEYYYLAARCSSRLGKIKEAKVALQACFERDKSYRQLALDDADLEPVWRSLA